MNIGSVNGAVTQVRVATKTIEIATNGGVAQRTIKQSELGIPEKCNILMANVYPLHEAKTDDIWTAIFYGYSWNEREKAVEIAVNGRLTNLQRQVFEVKVLYC